MSHLPARKPRDKGLETKEPLLVSFLYDVEADGMEYSDDEGDLVERSDDEVQQKVREYLAQWYDLDVDDEPDEVDRTQYNNANKQLMSLKTVLKSSNLVRSQSYRVHLFHTKGLYPNTYKMCQGKPYNYFKADINTSLHTLFELLLSIAVMTENRALCAGVSSYNLSARIGMLLPGKRHDGHVNTLEDFAFEGERVRVLYPEKKNEQPYYKVHMLDAGLAERAMRILYSNNEPLKNEDILAVLVSSGILDYFTITSGHKFTLQFVRNISLTMFPFVWDTTPIHENSLTAISMQAHHKDISTSLIYTNSKVIGTVARKGSLKIDGGNLQVA